MNKNKRTIEIFVSGFALFAIFFGAGNLIFPPILGNMTGDSWWKAMLGFLATDPVLPILGVIAMARIGGGPEDMGKRVHPKFAIILSAICILIIGPVIAVPRTAATTYELAIQPYLGTNTVALVITSIVFFGIAFFFTVNEGRVIDIIGKFLTPGLLLVLAAIIVKAILSPIGPIVNTGYENSFHLGFTEGYQTLDALAAAIIGGIVISGLKHKGYDDKDEQRYILIRSGIVAGILLAFVYGGLTFVGATTSATPETNRIALLLYSVRQIFGNAGGVLLGISVALACMTTAVGLISACGNFFNQVSGGKLPYRTVVIATTLFSFAMSMMSVEGIINLAFPILLTVYPAVIVLIALTLFDKQIHSNLSYIGPVFTALVFGFVEAVNSSFGWFEGLHAIIMKVPLAEAGFPWVVPAAIAFLVFTTIASMLGHTDDIGEKNLLIKRQRMTSVI